MQSVTDILLSADFWKIAFPAAAAIVAWFVNERSKLAWEQYKRKEEHYKELLRCLKGFHLASQDRELKNQFLHQANLLWLYAPDAVIRVAYAFLELQKTGATASDAEKQLAAGALIEAVRKDLLARHVVRSSKLSATEFRNYVST